MRVKREEQQSLHGKTVLITRARVQYAHITGRLESLGASVIHCPTIEIVPPTSWAALDASIDKLEEYDWIVFASANAVEFFIRRLRDHFGQITLSNGLNRLHDSPITIILLVDSI